MSVKILIGPPCSGKSTRAREESAGSDVIVDYDLIAHAIGSESPHKPTGNIRSLAFDVREKLIDEILKRGDVDAFIIHTSPSLSQIKRYKEHECEFQILSTDMDECLSRCGKDDRPDGTEQVIRDWFDSSSKLKLSIEKDAEREVSKMEKNEYRSGLPVEIRAEGEAIKVSGYAAVFNQEADIGGWFREVIAPGAFKDAIGRDDVVFLINHEGLPLARTRSGTLTIREDDKGLYMETELDPCDPDVMCIVPKMKRGDLDKMSFAFLPTIQEWDESGDIPIRTIMEASLSDVSIVTNPAYDGTDIGLRSLDAHRESLKNNMHNSASNAARMRMKLSLSEASAR